MPPAYPAPSPHGYIPLILASNFSSRHILTGEDVLVSTPHKIVLGLLKSLILYAKEFKASLILNVISLENNSLRFA